MASWGSSLDTAIRGGLLPQSLPPDRSPSPLHRRRRGQLMHQSGPKAFRVTVIVITAATVTLCACEPVQQIIKRRSLPVGLPSALPRAVRHAGGDAGHRERSSTAPHPGLAGTTNRSTPDTSGRAPDGGQKTLRVHARRSVRSGCCGGLARADKKRGRSNA
jgi:hypothetical protein